MDVREAVRQYLVDRDPGDEVDIRKRLSPPPRPLGPGEQWDGSQIVYSDGWIDEDGEVVAFEA